MAQKGLRVYEHFDELIGGPPVFTRTGMVLVVHERDRAGLETNLAAQRELGIDVRLATGQVLADIDPNVRLADDEVAAFEAEAGHVEAVQVIASLADAARERGADLRLGVEVKAVVLDGGRVAGVDTNEGRYECRTLVLAAGPWSTSLAHRQAHAAGPGRPDPGRAFPPATGLWPTRGDLRRFRAGHLFQAGAG